MEVCQGPGPIIEEIEEEEVTPAISSPPEEAPLPGPLHNTTDPTPPGPPTPPGTLTPPGPLTPPGLLTSHEDLVSVNSLYYNVNNFLNITLYIQVNYKIMSIEYECSV